MQCDMLVFFFFQAEDGIRDYKVTGVQTCALPISGVGLCKIWTIVNEVAQQKPTPVLRIGLIGYGSADKDIKFFPLSNDLDKVFEHQIGRASCRERVEISVGAGSFKKKKKENERRQ